jgi:hypothetical protein
MGDHGNSREIGTQCQFVFHPLSIIWALIQYPQIGLRELTFVLLCSGFLIFISRPRQREMEIGCRRDPKTTGAVLRAPHL